MVNLIQALILSIVQGITEWFPISSSGHLIITQNLLGVKDFGFIIYLHFASILAVIILFWKDIINLFVKKKYDYMIKILIAVIPVAIVGFFIRDFVRNLFNNLLLIGLVFIVFGVYIYFTKYTHEITNMPSKSDSLFIGISQAFALFPGVSRSGMAIGSGLIQGLKKDQAIKFSFLLAIPIVFGAAIYESREISISSIHPLVFLTSFTVTLLISLLTVNFLIKVIKSGKFYYFGYYNIIVGILSIIYYFAFP